MERNEPLSSPERGSSRATNKVVTVLSIALGLLFIVTGVLKLLGSDYAVLPGSAMLTHPTWFRAVAGVVEVVCGVLLMIPAASAFGAAGLALVMAGGVYSLLVTRQGGAIYPAVLFILLAVVAWERRPDDIRQAINDEWSHEHRLLREAAVTGFFGATAIAIWFLIVDTIAGQPFQTPIILGRALLSVLGPAPAPDADALVVAIYTVVHYLAFFAVALLAVLVVNWARTEPTVLAGALILFVAFEIGFHGFVALLQETTGLGGLAWWQIMVGNLLAAAVMGTYLWRQHPELADEFRHTLEGTV